MSKTHKIGLAIASVATLVAVASPAFADRYQDLQYTANSLSSSAQSLANTLAYSRDSSIASKQDVQRLVNDTSVLASSLSSVSYNRDRLRMYQQVISDYGVVRNDMHSSYTISVGTDDTWYSNFVASYNDVTQNTYRLRSIVANQDLQPAQPVPVPPPYNPGPSPYPPHGPGPGPNPGPFPGPQPVPQPPQEQFVTKALTPQTSGGQAGGDFTVTVDSSVAVRSIVVRAQTASFKVASYSDAVITLVDGTQISHNGFIGQLDGSGNPRTADLELLSFPRPVRVQSVKFHVDKKIDWFYIMGTVPTITVNR